MSMNAGQYPCDRGIPGNTATRGWHHFQANAHGSVCTFCGQVAAVRSWMPPSPPPMPKYRGLFSTWLPW